MFDLGSAVIDAGTTLWFRLPIVMAACSSHLKPQDVTEIRRMTSEKMLAAAQGVMHSQFELSRLALLSMTGKRSSKDVRSGAATVASAALRPALRTVKANARRLRKQRRK
jgi:hypothetical protein